LTGATYAESLGRGISVIRLPLPFPALRHVNAYVIEGESDLTLIDCGVDDGPTRYALERGLGELGRSLGDISRVICTHMHPDHMGLAYRLADEGMTVVMHETATEGADYYNDWGVFSRRLGVLAAEHGAPADFVTRMSAVDPRPEWAGTAIPPSEPVADYDRITVDGERWLTVVYTPGHELSHICLLDSATGALFSGDHVLPRITPVVMYGREEPDPLGTYIQSLARIEEMGIATTYPAHGSILDRGSLRARQIILHHERRLGAMAHAVRQRPKTAWQLVGEIFRPHLDPLQERMAFAETLAHLEYLRLRDELIRSDEGGAWHYMSARTPKP